MLHLPPLSHQQLSHLDFHNSSRHTRSACDQSKRPNSVPLKIRSRLALYLCHIFDSPGLTCICSTHNHFSSSTTIRFLHFPRFYQLLLPISHFPHSYLIYPSSQPFNDTPHGCRCFENSRRTLSHVPFRPTTAPDRFILFRRSLQW